MSGFMKKVTERQCTNRKKVQEKLQGESYLYAGDPSLQWGTGGPIRARCNLIYGPTRSGKSTLALLWAVFEQKKTEGWIIVFDSEYAYDDPFEFDDDGKLTSKAKTARIRYEKAGVNIDKFMIIQSNKPNVLFGELSDLEEDINKGNLNVSAVIVDSWGGVESEKESKQIGNGDITAAGNQYGGNAKTMGPILKVLLRISAENGTTMFFVQHCNQGLDQYGPQWVLIGGEKLKYLVHGITFIESVNAKDASLLEGGVATTKETKASDIIARTGKKIRFLCEKSRSMVEGRKGEFWFDFENFRFALPEESIFNLAVKLGVIGHPVVPDCYEAGPKKDQQKKDGDGNPKTKIQKAYWEFPVGAATPMKFHGKPGMLEAISENRDLYNNIYAACMKSNKKDAIGEKIGQELNDEAESKKSQYRVSGKKKVSGKRSLKK